MCGINGIFGLENLNQPETIVNRMNIALEHRGPNASGLFRDDWVCLGHKRLSIIDLSENANQPFHDASKRYTIVYNGELYNFETIRGQLNSFESRTKSDTEVLIQALIQKKVEALKLFNGMFAFAFWDSAEKELLLVRDRLGIKPLYYFRDEQSIYFSSEIRALLASGNISRKLNHAALSEYLQFQTVHAPNTIIEGIKSLPPGCYLRINDNEFEIIEYWNPVKEEFNLGDPGAVKSKINLLLNESVSERLISDVPLGAFLSGGIDSSVIVGLMSRQSNKRVSTFHIGFNEKEFSEAEHAKLVAERFNTIHHEIILEPKYLLEILPECFRNMDHPSGDGPNTWLVSQKTKEAGLTVALSGLGGDELFGGYPLFKRLASLSNKKYLQSFPKFFRRYIAEIRMAVSPGVASNKFMELMELDYFDLENMYPIMRMAYTSAQKDLLIAGQIQNRGITDIMHSTIGQNSSFQNLPFLSKISLAEMKTYMSNVLLRDTDQMSMAHALEVRVPFLDHNLVEYVLNIPDAIKYPTSPKKLLIESFPDLIPPEIYNRPKMGFTLPWDSWLKNELKNEAQLLLNNLADRNIFNPMAIEQNWSNFLASRKGITWSRIWILIVLEKWLELNAVES